MKNFYTEEGWNEILKEQEKVLRYDTFNRKQALELGLMIAEIAEEKYHGAVAVRIVEDETDIFAYKMEGATLEADWWMTNKLAASRLTRMSSLRALTASRAGELEPVWKAREENFFVCGGCIPVLMKDGSRPYSYVMVSGMEHWDDHQVIADAMASQLGVEICEIKKGMLSNR